jgi:hypothetical protein
MRIASILACNFPSPSLRREVLMFANRDPLLSTKTGTNRSVVQVCSSRLPIAVAEGDVNATGVIRSNVFVEGIDLCGVGAAGEGAGRGHGRDGFTVDCGM